MKKKLNYSRFRLEFNEEQQSFHHNHGKNEPETYGWSTIVPDIHYKDEFAFWCFHNSIDGIKKQTAEGLKKRYKQYCKFKESLAIVHGKIVINNEDITP